MTASYAATSDQPTAEPVESNLLEAIVAEIVSATKLTTVERVDFDQLDLRCTEAAR